jgi:predicted  nucleic acid-binding Zn ribbon protein
MYTHQLSIKVADAANIADAFSEFEFLLASYRSSGQILGTEFNAFIDNGNISSIVRTHEEDSLSSQYNNFYVKLRTERLEELCSNKMMVERKGQLHDTATVCNCAKSDFYMLIADHSVVDSPVKCGTCFEVVPLYKLPAYYEHGFGPVLTWEANYQACDTLQINAEVGEEWATEQMSNPNSELSINGRSIAAGIEQNTGINTYYYLHNAKETTVEDELDSKCPACTNDWLLMQPLAGGIFPFKCDNCRLISTFSSGLQG